MGVQYQTISVKQQYISSNEEKQKDFYLNTFSSNKVYFDLYHIFKFYYTSYNVDSMNIKTGYYVGKSN